MDSEPLILVVNDDGITAKGIRSLVEVAKKFGKVVVVAPDKAQSGMGHAVTINGIIRAQEQNIFGEGVQAYSCSGTPADCVKFGISQIIKKKPDLILSGVNHGNNTATNVLYSGTMSAALEGAMEGIPSIGFSLDAYEADANFDAAKEVVAKIVRMALDKGIMEGTCLNVNVPNPDKTVVKGMKICRQAHAYWADRFEKREDQFGKPYYWLSGDFVDVTADEDTDLDWIAKGYATIVPTQFDMTSYSAIREMENWQL